MSEVILGIDLGTTNSLAGLVDGGFVVLLPVQENKRLLPSVVQYRQEIPLTGIEAKRSRAVFPRDTVYSAKRFMGRRYAELSADELEIDYVVSEAPDGMVQVRTDSGRVLGPVDVSAEILRTLKVAAENYLEHPVSKAVITVPAYFNDAQRQATKAAGEQAGLQVERILNEPTAAALAYGVDRDLKSGRIAVYDLGGGTFDVSILELNDGVFRVLSTSGNTRLGGDNIDAALADRLETVLADAHGVRMHPSLKASLREAAEKAKVRLSSEEQAVVDIPFVEGDLHFHYEISRTELEQLALPILEKTRQHCLRALKDAGLQSSDLAEVLLVGGQTRMPLVRDLARKIFQREPNTSTDPDEAVARGAVIQAGILSGALKNMVLLDVTPLSLGIETFGGLMNVLIPRNSTIPTKAGELFTTAVDHQESMRIRILQGERELARDNWPLGEFTLEFPKAARGIPRLGVQFEIDADGILSVLARDVKSGREKILKIESAAVDVADAQVERMVSESVEHAFEDMAERQWIEASGKAGRLLEAARKALQIGGGELTAEKQELIRRRMAELESALPDKKVPVIKERMRALDEATAELAEVLMDRAMMQALQQKGHV